MKTVGGGWRGGIRKIISSSPPWLPSSYIPAEKEKGVADAILTWIEPPPLPPSPLFLPQSEIIHAREESRASRLRAF